MNKKKSVSIILTIILTILIGITGCGTKNIQNSSGSSDRLASSDNLIVSDTSDLTDTTNNDPHTSSETQSKNSQLFLYPAMIFLPETIWVITEATSQTIGTVSR